MHHLLSVYPSRFSLFFSLSFFSLSPFLSLSLSLSLFLSSPKLKFCNRGKVGYKKLNFCSNKWSKRVRLDSLSQDSFKLWSCLQVTTRLILKWVSELSHNSFDTETSFRTFSQLVSELPKWGRVIGSRKLVRKNRLFDQTTIFSTNRTLLQYDGMEILQRKNLRRKEREKERREWERKEKERNLKEREGIMNTNLRESSSRLPSIGSWRKLEPWKKFVWRREKFSLSLSVFLFLSPSSRLREREKKKGSKIGD